MKIIKLIFIYLNILIIRKKIIICIRLLLYIIIRNIHPRINYKKREIFTNIPWFNHVCNLKSLLMIKSMSREQGPMEKFNYRCICWLYMLHYMCTIHAIIFPKSIWNNWLSIRVLSVNRSLDPWPFQFRYTL